MKIEIIARPSGQAPDWVRDAWIGVQFDAERDAPVNGDRYYGVLGGRPSRDNLGGYRVNGRLAIEALTSKNPKAAQWWKDNAPYVLGLGALVFGSSFCKEIES